MTHDFTLDSYHLLWYLDLTLALRDWRWSVKVDLFKLTWDLTSTCLQGFVRTHGKKIKLHTGEVKTRGILTRPTTTPSHTALPPPSSSLTGRPCRVVLCRVDEMMKCCLVLQQQDHDLCVKSFTAQWELRQTKQSASHTQIQQELDLLCMWTQSMFLCFEFSLGRSLFGLLFCFPAGITDDGSGMCFSAWIHALNETSRSIWITFGHLSRTSVVWPNEKWIQVCVLRRPTLISWTDVCVI